MAVYIVTGKLGNGKTLVTVGRIRDALFKHQRVATNLDIDLKAMFHKDAKNIDFVRIPDKPSIDDLNIIGRGYEGDYDEEKFGHLILDECGTWFNSRNWQDKTRKEVNDWFLHARKLRWHVYIIIQDISMLDSQARDAIGEMLVQCRRLDRVRIPVIGVLVKLLTGYNLTLPRIHRAKVTYSCEDIISDVWVYRGNDLFKCYKTDQIFLHNYPHGAHCILPPWYTHGRYSKPLTWSRVMRLTKIYWKRFKSPVALATGLLFGVSLMLVVNARPIEASIQAHLPVAKTQSVSTASFSSASSSSSAQGKAANPESPETSLIAKLRITGHYMINNLITYTFSAGSPDQYYTSTDLSGMGFTVTPLSDCSVKVAMGNSSNFIRCF